MENKPVYNRTGLILRAVEPEDVDFMLECEKVDDTALWSDYRAPLSRNQLLTYALTYDADPFSAGQLRLIAENDRGTSVGMIDLYGISERDRRAFVGITIHPDFRNLGYAVMALEELSKISKDRLGLNQLAAKVSTANKKALRLFPKAGFTQRALLPKWHRIGQDFHDFVLFTR